MAIIKIKQTWFEFISFLKNPREFESKEETKTDKLKYIFKRILPMHILITLILIAFVSTFESLFKLNLSDNSKLKDFGKYVLFFTGVFFAPLIEELIFRYPLLKLTKKYYSNWPVYIFSFAFGAIHYFNYNLDNKWVILLPLITIIQIYMGFLLSFIRLKFGFWYGVLFHAFHNFVLIGPTVLFFWDKMAK